MGCRCWARVSATSFLSDTESSLAAFFFDSLFTTSCKTRASPAGTHTHLPSAPKSSFLDVTPSFSRAVHKDFSEYPAASRKSTAPDVTCLPDAVKASSAEMVITSSLHATAKDGASPALGGCVDASLIRANLSWDRLVERFVDDVLSENQTEEEVEVERKGRQSGKYKKVSTIDPDATMATNARSRRSEPAYKQHTAVDDKVGVILDVAVTTGQTNEGEMAASRRSRSHHRNRHQGGHGWCWLCGCEISGALERRDFGALIPAKAEPIKSRVPLRHFRFAPRSPAA
jgi:hypothetical protein